MARRVRGIMTPPGSVLARELSRGATVLGPDGRDVTTAVRTAFRAALPACGGDTATAARRALDEVVAGQRREEVR
jgi:hypothetical protein